MSSHDTRLCKNDGSIHRFLIGLNTNSSSTTRRAQVGTCMSRLSQQCSRHIDMMITIRHHIGPGEVDHDIITTLLPATISEGYQRSVAASTLGADHMLLAVYFHRSSTITYLLSYQSTQVSSSRHIIDLMWPSIVIEQLTQQAHSLPRR
jgi:hypothetical protein